MKSNEHMPAFCADLVTARGRAEKAIQTLSKLVLDARKPPAGAYAFFNHNAHTLARVQDVGRIIKRLCDGRATLTRLSILQDKVTPAEQPRGAPLPEEVQKIWSEEHEANGDMQLDMESLYIFGGILLDQWALQAIAVGAIKLKRENPFAELIAHLESSAKTPLDPLWIRLKPRMRWLHYQMRFYRNRFIVHATRPWQRGTTRSVYGNDYNLFTPTPPGWLDDDKLDREIQGLSDLAPGYVPRNPPHAGELIERLFAAIGTIENKEDRDRIARLFGQKGGSTPSFEVLAKNLLEFVADATEALASIAADDTDRVDLGAPHRTTEWRISR